MISDYGILKKHKEKLSVMGERMKKYVIFLWLLLFCIAGCSAEETVPNEVDISTQETEAEKEPLITYDEAFDYVSGAEKVIVDSNKYSVNDMKDNAAEKIIYSDEYAALYCSYWRVLEEVEGENDSRFEKSKMRWQMDFSDDTWTSLLKEKLETEGVEAFKDEYFRIYDEEVFPAVQYRWENGIVN